MDKGTSEIRDEIKNDVSDILRTRLAMAKKLELLEGRIQDTVEETKAAMLEVVDTVRDTAEDFVDRAKRSMNPIYQVQQHPWIMLGTAVLGGFLLARYASQDRSGNSHRTMPPGEYSGTPAEEGERSVSSRFMSRMSGWQDDMMTELTDQVQNELTHVKGALMTAAQTFLREMAKQALHLITDALERATAGGRPGGNPNGGVRHPRY
jgi:ElaB/YqjD/DUF883 family membrane-anchored ribosome-binding protein